MAVVVDTLVEMDRTIGVRLVVEEDHSISIQMEQKHLDGSNTENAKLNLYKQFSYTLITLTA